MSTLTRANNFDAIRLAAAAMVLCSHQFALLGQPEPQPFGLLRLGTLGVLVFFSVSGYLVAQSWERDGHPWRFAVRRFLRVWPALAVVTVLTAAVFGPVLSAWRLGDYVRSGLTWAYLRQLYLQVQLFLPGVFDQLPIKVVNGSLWTIPIEVAWYGILMLAGVAGLLGIRARCLLLAVVVAYAIYIYGIFDVQHNVRAAYLHPDFGKEYGTYFCAGVLMHRWRTCWQRHQNLVAVMLMAAGAVLVIVDHAYTALFLLLPFMAIAFGEQSTPVLRSCGRYGDFSYGIYIYAFLVQQCLIQAIGVHHGYTVTLIGSLLATLACAWLSWHLVEQPALSLKRRLHGRGTSSAPAVPAKCESETTA